MTEENSSRLVSADARGQAEAHFHQIKPTPVPAQTEALDRPAMRQEAPPEMRREELREEDPRAAAAKRAAEILGNFDGTEMEGDADEFMAPPAPPGWSYEWKMVTVLNKEDPGRMMGYRRTGWNEVPAKRHPDMMPLGYKGHTIERKGLVLMERPQEITDRFKERDRRAARELVRDKEEQLSSAPQGGPVRPQ